MYGYTANKSGRMNRPPVKHSNSVSIYIKFSCPSIGTIFEAILT